MTIEERKIELIRWITDLKDGSMLDRMDELRQAASGTVPEGIMHLLEASSAADSPTLVDHTTAKDLVKRK